MSEIEELRAEVARLRKELDELKSRGTTVNHYHYSQPQTLLPPAPAPYYPGGPIPLTCGAVGASDPPYWAAGLPGRHWVD